MASDRTGMASDRTGILSYFQSNVPKLKRSCRVTIYNYIRNEEVAAKARADAEGEESPANLIIHNGDAKGRRLPVIVGDNLSDDQLRYLVRYIESELKKDTVTE
jgi:hypothetical protein